MFFLTFVGIQSSLDECFYGESSLCKQKIKQTNNIEERHIVWSFAFIFISREKKWNNGLCLNL